MLASCPYCARRTRAAQTSAAGTRFGNAGVRSARPSETDHFHDPSSVPAAMLARCTRVLPLAARAARLQGLRPVTTLYSKTHEYAIISDDKKTALLGVSDHAQHSLGDLVYVELPEVGATVSSGAEFSNLESVKAASGVNSPVSGTVLEVNTVLAETPALINQDPLGKGWIAKIELSEPAPSDLMNSKAYAKFLETESH